VGGSVGSGDRGRTVPAVLVAKVPDWRDTRIEVKEGAVAIYGKDAIAANSRRTRLHSTLDGVLCRMNRTQDDGVRLHRALDRFLDSAEEPEASDSDEEETDDDAEPNVMHTRTKIPYDSSLDELQRTLDATFGSGRSRVIAMDTASESLRLGNPDDNAHDAVGKFPIGFDINTRARLPWFGALRNWIGRQPMSAKVRDLHQATLQKLLHELQIAA